MASSRVCFAVLFSVVTFAPLPVLAQVDGASTPLRLRPGDAVRLQVRDEPELGGSSSPVGLIPVAAGRSPRRAPTSKRRGSVDAPGPPDRIGQL